MVAIASDLAKEIGGLTVGSSRAYSNRESRENEYGYCISTATADRVHA